MSCPSSPSVVIRLFTTPLYNSAAAVSNIAAVLHLLLYRALTFLRRFAPVVGSHLSTLGYRSACVCAGPHLVPSFDLLGAGVELFLFLGHQLTSLAAWIFGTASAHGLS